MTSVMRLKQMGKPVEEIKQVGMREEFASTRRLILKNRDKTMQGDFRQGGRVFVG